MSTATADGPDAPAALQGPASPRPPRRKVKQDSTSLIGHRTITPYLFSAPAIAMVSLILGYPVLYGLYQSLFRAESLGGDRTFVGVENYTDRFVDPEFHSAVERTAVFVGGCLLLGTFLSLLFAFALNRVVKRLRFLRAVTIAPYIVSSVAAAVMFRILFHRNFGQINVTLEFFGLEGQEWLGDPTRAMFAAIATQVWTDLPLSVIILLGALQTIDPSFEDAARVDGATAWQRARFLSMPLIMPQIAISTVWLSYGTMTSLGTVLALTGGGPLGATTTLPIYLYETAFERLRVNEALAVATIILVLNAVLTLGYLRLARRYEV